MNNSFENQGNGFDQNMGMNNNQPIDIPMPDMNTTSAQPMPNPEPIDIPMPDVNMNQPMPNPQPNMGMPTPDPMMNPMPDMNMAPAQPMPNQQPNMGMPTPDPMMNQVPGMGAPVPGAMPNQNPQPKSNKMFLIIGIVVVLIVVGVVLAIVFLGGGGQKAVCTFTESSNGLTMTMKSTFVQKKDYVNTVVDIDITKSGGFTEDQINQIKEQYGSENEGVKIKATKDKITITMSQQDSESTLEDLKQSMIDMGGTCK
jgi:flagellar basal body-associated protein FliL